MAKQTINIGSSANDGTGDDLRTGGQKINDNFDELYNILTPEIITIDSDGTTVVNFSTSINTINLVYLNNNLVEKDIDYTVTGGSQITFEYGLNENDKVIKR